MKSLLAALLAVLALAAPAAAADHAPVRFWSVSKLEHGTGEVPLQSGTQVGGKLVKSVDDGRTIFNLPLHAPYWYFLPRDRAFGSVFSNESGKQYSVLAQAPAPNPYRIGAPNGTVTHLDEYQAYTKRDGDATLKVTLSDLLLQTVDDNNSLAAWECASGQRCTPVRAIVRFHARAYAASAGGDFYDAGGTAYLQGHQHSWQPGAWTSADSARPLWGENDFSVDGDADDSNTGAAGVMFVNHAIKVRIPLAAVHRGELFAVHVSLEAEAVTDREGETAAQAFVQDPQHGATGPLLTTHGLVPRGKPHFKEPRERVPAARCGKRVRHAGVMQLSSGAFNAGESGSAFVLITRHGGSHGPASVQLTTHAGSASARDFTAVAQTVRFAAGETGARLVEIPMREDAAEEPPETFTVQLGHAHCGDLGKRHRATVTIDDDETLPPPPPTGFTIGGTVDGLQGSGLVLTNFGADTPVSANGPFTFPGDRPAGTTYDVEVRTQPQNQVCTVEHGRGTVSANVTDVAVHCAAQSLTGGLDPTFGSHGRVSTPVGGGHGEAIVVQPDDGIITAGRRTTAGGVDFALTRHDASGNLDTSFGTNGIVTTDLGNADDEAYDAAATSDGGIVVVGRSDHGFAVARYHADGTSIGVVKTDVLDGGDQANAVAVQPDGKIVVAGSAVRNGIDGDVAVVRYNADGTPDDSFGSHGVVTTDLGTQSDSARALAIAPDGKIVVAGSADENIGLVRYTSAGVLDTTFGTVGKTVTDLGSDDVANGVAFDHGGHIVIAGYTLGAAVNRDFLLGRYTADGHLETTVKTDFGGDDFAENLVVDGAGRVVLVGRVTSATTLDMALARYRPDLTLDTSFDGDGKLTADFHGRGEFGQDVAIDSRDRIVAGGYTANGSDTEFALLRATP